MARALPQSQPDDYRSPGEWQSLRGELVALLDQVESQVARSQHESSLGERVRDLRFQVAEAEPESRRRDALRQVQRAITRFEDPAPHQMPPNPRDSLQAAINQIRSRQGDARVPMAAPPSAGLDAVAIEKLAQSVGGLSGRLERLEGEIKAQVKTGANVKDVADQVAQLAHVVELLAGAVGESGQVKRLEGQIASLGKLMSQGREMDAATLTRRLDDVAATVGKLAELQVHYADRVENPVASQAFKDGMRSIEESVRNVYDRIDSLERQASLSPRELEHVTAEMARFTEVLRENSGAPQGLVELIDALNTRISEIESGDRLLHGLRKDLSALRDSVLAQLAPRFDQIEQRMDGLSTRDDMAEIGRQIGMLSDRIADRPIDPGLGQLETQVRQLVARMDQTGEQLSGLAKLYVEPSVAMPDFEAVADLVAARTAEAMQHGVPVQNTSLSDTISGLESRIMAMLQEMRHDPEVNDFGAVHTGISEVNERLKRLETSLLERGNASSPATDIGSLITAASMPRDAMPRDPGADAPLTAPPFPAPAGPIESALADLGPRRRHPGLEPDLSLAARHDVKAEMPPVGFEPERIAVPAAPQPSLEFRADEPVEASPVVPPASRNTFIEAARRASSRKPSMAGGSANPNSLIGKALARFQAANEGNFSPSPPPSRVLAGDKPARKPTKAEPLKPPAVEPHVAVAEASAEPETPQGFLARYRKVILLGITVVALVALAANLVVQRLNQAEPAAPAEVPVTTGDIDQDMTPAEPTAGDALTSSMPPRVIPLAETITTGSIDRSAALGFSPIAPSQEMPSAFAAATDVANVDPSAVSVPSAEPEQAPMKVEMPPEGIGPLELRQAAASGDPRAQFEVAAIYTEGRAVPQDLGAAATWYERAATSGFAPAEYRLGSLYESGSGVTKNLDTARLWYERAAEAGNRMSMHNLAALYAGGQMGKQQFDSAAKWFTEAAERGLTDSQFNLGMLYARGLGVKQSLEDSFKWFGIAALTGDKDAAKARDDIARSLDADTMARLTAEVNSFKPTPIDLAANFAPIGTWMKSFDPGETIATHDIVQSVQKALVKLGYDVGTPDGIAGKKTADAIKSFEQATGMSQVGLVNPRLLAVLGSQPV